MLKEEVQMTGEQVVSTDGQEEHTTAPVREIIDLS
jgi:hypothetical protein